MKTKCSKFLLAVLAIALSSNSALAAETIKIGVGGAHTGDVASYGMPTLNAAKIIAEEVNAKGGILGMQVEIIAQDDQCKPEMATNAATKLVSEKVNAIIGHICSGATKSSLPIYNEAKLVAVSPSATNPDLTNGSYPFFFRTIAPDNEQALLGVKFAIEKLGAKKIAILHDKGDYGKGYADYSKKFIEDSGKATVVLYEGITPGAVDYTAVIRKLGQSGADAVMFGGYHPEASKLVQQMQKRKVKMAFISDDGAKDDTLIKVAGSAAEGAYASGPRDVAALPANIAARAAHVKKFGAEAGSFYDNGYAATVALLNAIEKAGTATDSTKIAEALRANLVDTPLGAIKFSKTGDAEGIGFNIYVVKNGKFEVVNF